MQSHDDRYITSILSLVLFLLNVQVVDEFIYELGLKESNIEKRRKIDSLALHEDEWTRVHLFCNLLQVSSVIYIFEYY